MINKIFFLSALILLILIHPNESLSQSASRDETSLKLGEITFRVREIQTAPSPLKVLEIYIEVLNRSKSMTFPPNSIRVAMAQKEVVFLNEKSQEEFSPPPQEVFLSPSLPPLTGRVLIFGFTIPREKVESITFEIQLNPPEGEKRTVKWEGGSSYNLN